MPNRAVFVDRDGTLNDDPGYVNHPDQVKLLEGVPEALRELQELGYKVIVATNQSGVARGIISEEMLDRIHERLQELLSEGDVLLDGIYCCPFHPEGVIPKFTKESDWRKPRPGMLLAAAKELDLDLGESWMIGDSQRDVQAGRSAGCRTILIRPPDSDRKETETGEPDHVAANIREAVNIVKRERNARQYDVATPAPKPEGPTMSETHAPTSAPSEEGQHVSSEGPGAPAQAERRPAPPASDAQVKRLLADILEQLKRNQKTDMFGEFSLLRMLAGIVQMFVLFCLVVAFWLLMSDNRRYEDIRVALGFATVLQVMALTFYTMQGRK
jgi:D-glycero-D-manno-heptose 1,7-bisphosphate phosphatase